jgi:hypothetical protein
MTKPKLDPHPTYESAAMVAQDLAMRVRELLLDLPTPAGKITWHHVGTMTEVANRLASVVALLEGSDR